jgi:SPP1 gp7 family putative phage head morphogenesis protein
MGIFDRVQEITRKAIKLREEFIRSRAGRFNVMPAGKSGTRIFGEFFDEEYLTKLQGIEAQDLFDQMKRSDDQINMLLTARKNPILQANWFIEPADKHPNPDLAKRQAEHVEYELMERMNTPFKSFLEEALSFIECGFSAFEVVHQPIFGDPRFNSYVGFKKFGFRSQRTIQRWGLCEDGSIDYIEQEAYGDQGFLGQIPGQYLVIFTLGKIGDNYEGVSALRPIYGNWYRKNIYQKLMGIGIEKYAVGTPIGTIPKGLEGEEAQKTKFENLLKALTSHQKNFITKPEGWNVEILKGQFDADKIQAAINAENLGMAKAFVAAHLELGTGGNGGAYALGTDMSDQFLSIIQNDGDIICRTMNRGPIKQLIDFNYGQQPYYPKLRVTGINDKLGKEYAEIVKTFVDGKIVTANKNLEIFVRDQYKMPKLTKEELLTIPDKRDPEPSKPFIPFEEEKLGDFDTAPEMLISEKKERPSVELADMREVKSEMARFYEKNTTELRAIMKKHLKGMSDDLINRIISKLEKSPKSQWQELARKEKIVPNREYKKELMLFMTTLSLRAEKVAAKEVGSTKLTELKIKNLTLDEVEDNLKKMFPRVRDLIKNQSELLVSTQASDLEKNLLFMLNGTVGSTNDPELIRKDLTSSRDDYLASASIVAAPANSVAQVISQTRDEFFAQDEIFEQIEAYQFVNNDPVSPICQDLNGTIFDKNDPESERFKPPLHHNCKSFVVPIFKLKPGQEIDKTGLKPSNPELEKYITLREHKHSHSCHTRE